ncbi:MAG: CarD family transcriptional regulator, partial [Terriglobales bacterium]
MKFATMTLPFVRDLLDQLARQSPLARVASAWQAGERVQLRGLTPPAQLLAAAQLQHLTRRPVLFVVPDNRTAEEWRDTLATFAELTGASSTEDERPLALPTFAVDPYEGLSPHPETLEQRALALWRWVDGLPFLIAPAVAAATRLPDADYYRRLVRRLHAGDLVDLSGLADQLQWMGYQRQDPVEMPGQFSIRGGLLDVFSPEAPRPVRLELFGDEIESLREFDPATQRSVAPVEQTLLLPLTSLPLAPHLRERLGPAPEPGWEFRIAGLEGFSRYLLDLRERPLLIISEPEAVTAELERWWRRLRERYDAERGPEPESIFFTPGQMHERLASVPLVEMRELRVDHVDLDAEAIEFGALPLPPAQVIDIPTRPASRYQGAVARMVDESRAALSSGERLFFLGSNPGEVERLGDLFTEYKLPFQFGSRPRRSGIDYLSEKAYFSAAGAAAIVALGTLTRGFSLPGQRVTFFGAADLFHEETVNAYATPPARRSNISTFLSDFRDLKPGDWVVHMEHGIARYVGLKEFDAGASDAAAHSGEFMILEYADAAKLYVPLTRMDLVQKYRSAEGAAAVLDRLGG